MSSVFKRVLIVEHNPALREAMVRSMRVLGAEVFESASVADAIAQLIEHTPDLVIADMILPDGSARALFEASRRLEPQPVGISISGEPSIEQAVELTRLGVRAFLAKPFTVHELKDTVRRLRLRPSLPPALELAPGSRAAAAALLRNATSRRLDRFIEECWHSWFAFVDGLRANDLVDPSAADEDLVAALEAARHEHENLPPRLRRSNSVSRRVVFFLSPFLSEKGRQWSRVESH
jgi:DNA-binding response OmpR family regulator